MFGLVTSGKNVAGKNDRQGKKVTGQQDFEHFVNIHKLG